MLKKYARAKDITEINYNGQLTTKPEHIANAFTEYYRELFFNGVPKEATFEKDFLSLSSMLDRQDTERLLVVMMAREIETDIY